MKARPNGNQRIVPEWPAVEARSPEVNVGGHGLMAGLGLYPAVYVEEQ